MVWYRFIFPVVVLRSNQKSPFKLSQAWPLLYIQVVIVIHFACSILKWDITGASNTNNKYRGGAGAPKFMLTAPWNISRRPQNLTDKPLQTVYDMVNTAEGFPMLHRYTYGTRTGSDKDTIAGWYMQDSRNLCGAYPPMVMDGRDPITVVKMKRLMLSEDETESGQ